MMNIGNHERKISDLPRGKETVLPLFLAALPKTYGEGAVRVVTIAVICVFAFTVLLFLGLIVLRLSGSKKEKLAEKKRQNIRLLIYKIVAGEQSPRRLFKRFPGKLSKVTGSI